MGRSGKENIALPLMETGLTVMTKVAVAEKTQIQFKPGLHNHSRLLCSAQETAGSTRTPIKIKYIVS